MIGDLNCLSSEVSANVERLGNLVNNASSPRGLFDTGHSQDASDGGAGYAIETYPIRVEEGKVYVGV